MLEPYDADEMATLKRAWRAGMEDARRHPEKYAALRKKGRDDYQQQLRDAKTRECEQPTDPLPLLRAAGFGDLFLQRMGVGVGVENWPAVAVARAWVDQHQVSTEPLPHPFLCLLGPTNGGKTQAAAVAAARWCVRNVRPRSTGDNRAEVALLSATELPGLAMWGQEGERRLEEATQARFLVLDDFGTEHITGPTRAVLFRVLDFRYAHRRRTVLSANMGADALQQRLDTDVPAGQQGRAFRRLSEHGWMAQVSREQGLLWVGGAEEKFPAFEAPKRRTRREEAARER